MSPLRRLILGILRDGPHNCVEIAVLLDRDHPELERHVRAPFYIRNELKVLKRDRYVYEHARESDIAWELTPKGWDVAGGPLAPALEAS
jgi:hypothetical protein